MLISPTNFHENLTIFTYYTSYDLWRPIYDPAINLNIFEMQYWLATPSFMNIRLSGSEQSKILFQS